MHPPFDIQDYGERILDKFSLLSLEASSSGVLSFSDLVKGQNKYDVARSFSSLLQLVIPLLAISNALLELLLHVKMFDTKGPN